MSEYYFIFVWLVVMAYLSMNFPVREKIRVLGKVEVRWKIIWAVIVFIPVIHLVSTKLPNGDMGVYIAAYTKAEASWASVLENLNAMDSGFGYSIFQKIVKIMTGGSVSAFRLILALCHSLPIILVFRKYSSDYLFSIFLFLASGCHLAWMMNGLRQFLAVVIVFAGTGFIVRKKLVPVIVLILIASTIHTSALMMLPIVFIVQGKAWNKKTLLYIMVAVIAMFIFSRRIDLMEALLVGTEYEGAVTNIQALGDDGVHPIRVLVNALPVILAFYNREKIGRENDPMLSMCVNMSVINLGIYLIAMVTSGILIGRLPIYVSLYSFLLLPYLIYKVDWGDYNVILRSGSIIGYMLYYFIQYRGIV